MRWTFFRANSKRHSANLGHITQVRSFYMTLNPGHTRRSSIVNPLWDIYIETDLETGLKTRGRKCNLEVALTRRDSIQRWRVPYRQHYGRWSWLHCWYLEMLASIKLLLNRDTLKTAGDCPRKIILEDNRWTQVDVITSTGECVSSGIFVEYLLHFSHGLLQIRKSEQLTADKERRCSLTRSSGILSHEITLYILKLAFSTFRHHAKLREAQSTQPNLS